uniref:Orfan n=1 Tax=Strongyloides venezuelensis TaxID=75913 RepID=A0A0K0G1P6_STRVS
MSLISNTSTPEEDDDDETYNLSEGASSLQSDEDITSTDDESEVSDSTQIDPLIAGKLKKYLKKYDLEYFKHSCSNKYIDLNNLPEVNPDSDNQFFYYEKCFVTKDEMDQLIASKVEEAKMEEDESSYEIMDSCDVMKKLANQDDCSTCHDDCKSCHNSHAKKWYNKLNVSSKNCDSQLTDSESLTYKSRFKDKYYTSLYCYPYNLLKYGNDIFKTYEKFEKDVQNSRIKRYRKILSDDGFEFVDDSMSIYKEKSGIKVKKNKKNNENN